MLEELEKFLDDNQMICIGQDESGLIGSDVDKLKEWIRDMVEEVVFNVTERLKDKLDENVRRNTSGSNWYKNALSDVYKELWN